LSKSGEDMKIEYVTLSQAVRALGRSRAWAYRLAAIGDLGQTVRVRGSKVRRIAVRDLEHRFGAIAPDRLLRAVMKGIEE